MSSRKRFTGDYTIEAIDGGAVVVTGDLTVTGTTTSIETTNLEVVDNEIVINSGETGAGVTLGTAGITVDRGTAPGGDAGIRFNETTDLWELNPGDGTWSAIAAGGGGGINNVVEDTTPQLGGNLDVNGQSITSVGGGDIVIVADTTGVVKIDQELTLVEQAAPPSLAGYSKLYANTAGAGGSGLYYVNSSDTDELVSKKKAMVFGLIF